MWFEICTASRPLRPDKIGFPSPYGECGLKWYDSAGFSGGGRVVSVPLRGMWFEIFLIPLSLHLNGDKFPSPYGECGLKSDCVARYSYAKYGEFPSPYGECGLKLVKDLAYKSRDIKGFRPLTGDVV